MSALEHLGERTKLARFLDRPESGLPALTEVPASAIRALREAAERQVYGGDGAMFQRAVASSKLLPVPLLALIAEKVLGPLLCARMSGQMDAQRGAAIAARLPTPFLAQTCLSLNPNSSAALIRAIPVERIVDVALEMAQRRDYITMARFTDVMPEAALRAVFSALRDDRVLLLSGLYVENKRALDRIIALLPRDRLERLTRLPATEPALWPECVHLLSQLDLHWRTDLAQLTVAGLDESQIDAMLTAVAQAGLWASATSLWALLDAPSAERLLFRITSLPADLRDPALHAARNEPALAALLPALA